MTDVQQIIAWLKQHEKTAGGEELQTLRRVLEGITNGWWRQPDSTKCMPSAYITSAAAARTLIKKTDETVMCRKCSNLIPVTKEQKDDAEDGKIFYCSCECYCNG